MSDTPRTDAEIAAAVDLPWPVRAQRMREFAHYLEREVAALRKLIVQLNEDVGIGEGVRVTYWSSRETEDVVAEIIKNSS